MADPHAQLDLAAVTLACVVAVAAAGSFMLHMDARAAACLQVAVLGPNIVYCFARHDQFGLFGALCLSGVAVVLQMETWSPTSMNELLRLRFALETVARQREEGPRCGRTPQRKPEPLSGHREPRNAHPLSGMLGTHIAEEENRRPVRRRLELVERSGEHLLTVLTDVLDFPALPGHLQVKVA